jgi:hypothetical protein
VDFAQSERTDLHGKREKLLTRALTMVSQ